MSISKNQIKYIRSLDLKKNRRETKEFLAEGPKLVDELLGVYPCTFLAATSQWLSGKNNIPADEINEISDGELSRVSLLKNPQQVLAVFRQPEYEIDLREIQTSLSLALDSIQDPGNLGTIIRIADWFGIENIICSTDTADVYNPKTIQATMGGIARVKVHYQELTEFLPKLDIPVYGTFLEGYTIYRQQLSPTGIIVMGNEGKGISPEIERLVTQKLLIPSFPENRETSESLNVAVATAIVCSEFRRAEFI